MTHFRWLLTLVIVGLAANVASAQRMGTTDERRPITPGGTEMFRLLLHLGKFEPIQFSNMFDQQRGVSYRDVVIVLFGTLQPNEIAWAHTIHANGGAVLIATDQWSHLAPFGVSFDGRHVYASDDVPRHRDLEGCPYLIPVHPDQLPPGLARERSEMWNIFRGLDRVAANQGTFLTLQQFGTDFRFPLAHYDKNCDVGFDIRHPLPRPGLFAVGGEIAHRGGNSSRFLALADQSVFINEMLNDPELHNFTLSTRVIEYLKDANGANRKYCVFVENGRTAQRFDDIAYALQNPPPPIPPLPPIGNYQDKIIDLANRMIDDMQSNDALNKLLLTNDPASRERRLRGLISTLLVVACAYMVFQLLRRLWSSRHPLDAPLPPVTGRPTKPDPTNPAGIFDRRQRELLRRDNLLEPVRDTVREMFLAAGAPTEASGPKLPKVFIDDVVRRPETLRKALADLWRIAHGPPNRLTVKRWSELEPLFVRAQRAFEDGKWRFAA